MNEWSGYLLIILLVTALAWVVLYNGLVKKRNEAETAWSNIDVQLKRRYDLIPNLVETVKGYAAHERETFETIAKLRTDFQSATTPKQFGEIEGQMSKAVNRLFALAEAYPDLKAGENFLMLQESLAGTENKIAYSRNNYNLATLQYNNAVETVPSALVARMSGFHKKEFFEIEEVAEREPVKVDLGKDGSR